MLFNSIFRNVNVTLHHEYAHNAVRSISWKVKFSFKEGGGRGVGTRPLTNVCFLRISLSTVPTTYVLCVHTRGFVHASRSTAITSPQRAVYHLVCAGLECTHKRLLVFSHQNTLLPHDYCIYKKQNKKQKKTMFKVSFLQARIRVTVQETV